MERGIKVSFQVTDEEKVYKFDRSEKNTLLCTVSNGIISCEIYYDFKEKPLLMTSEISKNDEVELILMPHRTELYINGVLKDEEWPVGKCLFEPENGCGAISEYTQPLDNNPKPAVLGTFENAFGWKPEKNVFVGDCMPYVNDNRYHVLYLKDRHHHRSKWGLGAHQWEHISTADFKTWQIHPMAVSITEQIEGSICTGSWIKKDDTQYLFYTVRMADGSSAPIKRSVSSDGYNFVKDDAFSMVLSEKYHGNAARDPKVVLDSDGIYHMFLTTALTENGHGCLAHLVSEDLTNWSECENPIYVHEDGNQPECPDYIEYNGYYYLIYSIKGKAHYLYSKEPFENWTAPENPIIPCSSVPKGAVWNGKIVFTGFELDKGGHYAGTMVFKSAMNDENGVLIFE